VRCEAPAALAEDRYVICVGSVGYGRDRIQKLRYAIYNQTENSVEFRAIDGELLSLGYL